MSCNTSESHVKPRPLTPLPANWRGWKKPLYKRIVQPENWGERERGEGRGGEGGGER